MSKAKIFSGALTAVLAFGAVYAMAATLGGMTSDKVGADNVAVASCDTDGVTSAYTSAWDAGDKRYEVSQVIVASVNDACDGQTLKVSLTDSAGVQLGEGSLAMPTSAATSFTVSVSPAPSAKLTEGVHAIIAS
ncbi:MAG: hypothetical protein LC808_41605 [Actinobacteria bacterium]|nr:hypothetical protein [Actinomycetota bacterium]